MRRRGDLWKRAQVVLLLLAVLVLAPFLMRSALTKHDPVAAFHQRAQSQPPPPRQVVAAAAPDVSEAALVGANRSLLLARASSLESESVAPLWLLGRPRCDNSSLCAFNRAVWSELDRVQHGRNVPCPADPKTVIGCELGWSTGLGHHLHHLGHCLTRSLMHGKPVVFVDLDWSYGRGCRKQPSDHSFECFFTRFANRCAALKGLDWERDGQAGVAGRRTLNGGGDYVSWGPSMESSYWVGPSLKSRCPTPDPPLALKAALIRYLFGLKQDSFENFLEHLAEEMRLRRPYTAIHIRRGDKIGTEAERHELWEYLSSALQLASEAPTVDRKLRVFVATDDPSVLVEAKTHYSAHFEFFCLPQAADMAAKGYSTVSGDGTRFTIADIAFLANADVLVGTFSSQISRLAFELMSSWRNATYVYAEKAPPSPETPIMFTTSKGIFRLPNERHKGIQVRAASLDSGYYYGAT